MRICAKTEENNDEIQLVLRVRELSLHLQMWLEHGVLGSVRGRQYGRSRASDGLLGLHGSDRSDRPQRVHGRNRRNRRNRRYRSDRPDRSHGCNGNRRDWGNGFHRCNGGYRRHRPDRSYGCNGNRRHRPHGADGAGNIRDRDRAATVISCVKCCDLRMNRRSLPLRVRKNCDIMGSFAGDCGCRIRTAADCGVVLREERQ